MHIITIHYNIQYIYRFILNLTGAYGVYSSGVEAIANRLYK